MKRRGKRETRMEIGEGRKQLGNEGLRGSSFYRGHWGWRLKRVGEVTDKRATKGKDYCSG